MGISPLISKRTPGRAIELGETRMTHQVLDDEGMACANENGIDQWDEYLDARFYAGHFAKDGRTYRVQSITWRLHSYDHVTVKVEGGA